MARVRVKLWPVKFRRCRHGSSICSVRSFELAAWAHLGSEYHNEREELGLSSVGGGHASGAEGD